MASPDRIRVMISSRCKDSIEFEGVPSTLSAVRLRLKLGLEQIQLLGSQLFEVWINEDAPPAEGTEDSWDVCLKQVRDADIVLVLYNGNAGWAKEGGDIGICHAEVKAALSTAAAKIRLVELPSSIEVDEDSETRNQRFQAYVKRQSLFRGAQATNGEEVIRRSEQTLREAVVAMARLGVREARRGRYHTGDALEWQRLDYSGRSQAMQKVLRETLLDREGAGNGEGDRVTVRVAGKSVLLVCHAIPDALSIPAALVPIGQPFLSDHQHFAFMNATTIGPVHLFACHQGVTGSQARKLLGFPDATIVQAPFGVYVADRVQKIQLIFLAQCRDDTSVRHGVQRFFDWLEQVEEGQPLAKRAAARKQIIRIIAKVHSDE